ncbi:MAG: hypothetical protein ACRD2A_10700 [Vicinamibacterales bacterium]
MPPRMKYVSCQNPAHGDRVELRHIVDDERRVLPTDRLADDVPDEGDEEQRDRDGYCYDDAEGRTRATAKGIRTRRFVMKSCSAVVVFHRARLGTGPH